MLMQTLMLWTAGLFMCQSTPTPYNAAHAETGACYVGRVEALELSSQLPFKAHLLSSLVHSQSDTIFRGSGAFN